MAPQRGTGGAISGDATAPSILWVMDRAQLRTYLDHLDDAVPALRASSPDRCHFLRAFAGMAQIIEAKALTAQDAEFVGRRINEILVWHGLRSMDEQGWGDVGCQSVDLLSRPLKSPR